MSRCGANDVHKIRALYKASVRTGDLLTSAHRNGLLGHLMGRPGSHGIVFIHGNSEDLLLQ